MKKGLSAFLAVLCILSCVVASASEGAEIQPRWTYMKAVGMKLQEENGDLSWGADAYAYVGSDVDEVSIQVKLQRYTTSGWITLATRTGREDGTAASAGDTYTSPIPGNYYRIEVYATAYINGTAVETTGPSYKYYTFPSTTTPGT